MIDVHYLVFSVLKTETSLTVPAYMRQRPVIFLSTWALSETPLKVRASVEDLLRRASGCLLAFHVKFGEVENHLYFERLVDVRPDAEAEIIPIEQVPGSAYAFLRARSPAGS